MNNLYKLEEIVGCIDDIEPLGIEPDFSSLGIEPVEVLGFKNDEDLEKALIILMQDKSNDQLTFIRHQNKNA